VESGSGKVGMADGMGRVEATTGRIVAAGHAPVPPGPSPSPLHALRLAAVVLPLLTLAVAGWSTWQIVFHAAAARVDRAADMLREHARSTIEAKDLAIAAVEQRIRGMGWDAIRQSREVYDFMVAIDAASPMPAGIGLVDPGGQLAMSSLTAFAAPPTDLSARDYVRAHPAGSGLREAPFVGAAVATRPSGFLGVPVARPRTGPDGLGDGGVISAVLPTRELQGFYAGIRETARDAVALVRLDGVVLAAVSPAPDIAAPLPAEAQRSLRRLREGRLAPQWLALAGDGEERLTALRLVPGLGVAVAYGLGQDALVQDWLRRMAVPLGGALAGMALLWALVWQTERALQARAAAESRSRRAERQATLGLLSGGLAHDFGNITQSVLAAAHLLGKHAQNAERVRVIGQHLARHAERAAALSRRMLEATRRNAVAPGAPREAVAVTERLRDLAILLNATLGAGIRVRAEVAPALAGRGFDPAELETAVINLAANARDAMPRGGLVRLLADRAVLSAGEAAALSLPEGAYLRVVVEDEGCGMDAATLRRFGEAFFTTKPEGEGSGLGVAMAAAFIRAAGGAMRAESEPGRGSRVTLYVPAA
jgi:two-component system NtrC family sensor kinase